MAAPESALSLAGPESLVLYENLLAAVEPLGRFQTEVKKTSIHLVRTSAFLGVHPRKQSLLITVKSAKPIQSSRIAKLEQVSKSRWHLDIKLSSAADIDAELLGWIADAYELCG